MLEEIKNQYGPADFKTGTECNGLQSYFQSSRFILTAFIFKHLFYVLEPLSKLLQTRDLDILAAVNFLKKAEKNIIKMRTDEEFLKIYEEAKSFCEDHFEDFDVNSLLSIRKRKIIRHPGELSSDESIQDPIQYFKITVYFTTIDIILQQINEKFNENSISVIKDIGLLSLKRIKENTLVPQDAFEKICEIYNLNQELVRNEYILFKSIIKDLDVDLLSKLPEKIHTDFDSDEEHSDEEESDGDMNDLKNLGSLFNIFEIINMINMKPEFENLYNIIKLS